MRFDRSFQHFSACQFCVLTFFVYPDSCSLDYPFIICFITGHQTLIRFLDFVSLITFCTFACSDCLIGFGLLFVTPTMSLSAYAAPVYLYLATACMTSPSLNKYTYSAYFLVAIGSSVLTPDITIWPEIESATPPTTQEAIWLQGQRLGQHESEIHSLHQNLQSLHARMTGIGDSLSGAQAAGPPVDVVPGAPGSWRSFLSQCTLIFELQPSIFQNASKSPVWSHSWLGRHVSG